MGKEAERDYRIQQLERKVTGLQRQVGVMNARYEVDSSKMSRKIRDLEIKTAVQQGVPQKKVAEIYEISTGRVSQIMKKIA
ncbi:hypothetical protein [Herbaspirillum rhizosphaerae]|uniref:hypothetical protein n=1 Tax=Herbaspirillum rhizosphaerae TaxID=346179 RepID=UPI00067E4587|nr:hypothetical protein [Herbaspirillum rhizosphaerae]